MGDLGFDFLSTSSTPSLSFDISWIFWVLTKFALLAHSCSLLWGKISHKPKKTLTMVFPTRFQTKIYNLHFYWDFCMLLIILKYHAKKKHVSNPINSRPQQSCNPPSSSSSSLNLLFKASSSYIGKILNNWLCRHSWWGLEVQWKRCFTIFSEKSSCGHFHSWYLSTTEILVGRRSHRVCGCDIW